VEAVERDRGIGEVLRRAADEGRCHVHDQLGDRLGSAVVGDEVGLEAPERVGAAARGREQEARPVEVDEQADVVVATPPARLVEPDPGRGAEVGGRPRLLHVVVQDPPDPGVVLADELRHRPHRHLGHEGHDEGLEQQAEAGLRASPRHRHLAHATAVAADARDPGVEVGLVLEEVEVLPAPPARVMDRAAGRTAVRAAEAAAGREVEVQIEPVADCVEFAALHPPRFSEAERLSQQIDVAHPGPPLAWHSWDDHDTDSIGCPSTHFSEEPQMSRYHLDRPRHSEQGSACREACAQGQTLSRWPADPRARWRDRDAPALVDRSGSTFSTHRCGGVCAGCPSTTIRVGLGSHLRRHARVPVSCQQLRPHYLFLRLQLIVEVRRCRHDQ